MVKNVIATVLKAIWKLPVPVRVGILLLVGCGVFFCWKLYRDQVKLFTFTGRILDAESRRAINPPPEVIVEIPQESPEHPPVDSDGYFGLEFTAQVHVTITVTADEYKPKRRDLTVSGGHTELILLERLSAPPIDKDRNHSTSEEKPEKSPKEESEPRIATHEFEFVGRLYDSESGEGVSKATVSIEIDGHTSEYLPVDSMGIFRKKIRMSRNEIGALIHVWAPGYDPFPMNHHATISASDTKTEQIALTKEKPKKKASDPLAEMDVSITARPSAKVNWWPGGEERNVVVKSSAPPFSVRLKPGNYVFVFYHEDYCSAKLPIIIANENQEVSFDFFKTGRPRSLGCPE